MTTTASENGRRRVERITHALALVGFTVYALAAPHSIAGSWMGISIAVIAWLLRWLATRRTGLRRTPLDLPLWLFFAWTVVSCIFSAEPRLSLPKIINAATFLMFYLTQSLVTRKSVLLIAGVMIVSASAGVLWGAGELFVGRGVIVKELRSDSPLRGVMPLREGDAVWRVNGRRVSSVAEIDEGLRRTPAGTPVKLSVISHGEHVEWPGLIVTEELRGAPSPSGITGGGRTHSFRASGWTRHYETFAELLQIIAQLALGLALANLKNHGPNKYFKLALFAAAVLGAGIVFTAMRTVLVAFVIGASLLAWLSLRGIPKLVFTAAMFVVIGFGAVVVW